MDFMKSPLFAKAVKMAAGVAALSFLDPAVSAFARNVPIYNTLINAAAPILTPLLVKASPIFKPVYMLTDLLLGKKLRNEQRPSASAKPIVVFSSITVTNEAKYKAEFAKFAEALQKGAGVRAAFSFMDTDKDRVALQFFWFDSPADFAGFPAELLACYASSPSSGDYCQVWGGWTEDFMGKFSLPYVKPISRVQPRGFLKDPFAAGFKTGSAPMIWISKRNVKAGRMAKCAEHFQYGTDMMYDNAPAALGICEYTDAEDPDQLWSLRVFNDFDYGFKAHFPVPSFILFRMVFNVIPEWMPGLFPIGFSFSSKEMIDKAVETNAGNKAYKQYYWDADLIGPAPDFGKGF